MEVTTLVQDLSVAVMSGGKSSRMGSDKAFVPFRGRPMVEHVLDRVAGLGSEILIIANDPRPYEYLGYPIFGDIYEESGPLGGIHAALCNAKQSHLLVVACDMPWLNRQLLKYMISLRQTADGIVPRWGKFPEPLHAIYSNSCLLPIEKNLKERNLKVVGFYRRAYIRFLDQQEIRRFDPEGLSFANINTPGDLAEGESTG